MKQLTVIMLSFLLPVMMTAQTNKIEKLFNKYENVNGFELLNVTKSDADLENLEGEEHLMDFLNGMHKMYILNFDTENGDAKDLEKFRSKLDQLLDEEEYEAVIDINGEEEFRMLMRKDDEKEAVRVLMIAKEDDETSFILATD